MIDRTKAPVIHSLPTMSMPEPEVETLPSGVKLATLSGGSDAIFRLTALVGGGLADGPNDYYPTLAAQHLREGTAAMTAPEVADALDYCGSWYLASALSHYLSAGVCGLTSRIHTVMPIFKAMLTTPAFSHTETNIGIRQLAQRLEIDRRRVKWHASAAATSLAMGATHPLAATSTPDEILATTPDDLRAYYALRYSPENITLFLAGRIDDSCHRAVADAFSELPAAPMPKLAGLQPFKYTTGTRVDIPVPDAKQNAVSMVLPGPKRTDPDYVLLRIAVVALGGYFGSRLMANIREDKGYTYGITAQLMGYPDGSFIKINSETSPDHVDDLINQTIAELQRMVTEPLSADELDRLRRHYTTNLVATLDSPISMADYHINRLTAGIPADYFNRQQEVLRSLTPELIASISERYLRPDLLSIAVAGV